VSRLSPPFFIANDSINSEVDTLIFPKKETTNNNYIIVDSKSIGIWDHCNLAKYGGIINLNNKFALEVVKLDNKWCQWYIIQYGAEGVKRKQEFNAVKTVKDDSQIKKLKEELKLLVADNKGLIKRNSKLASELAEYKIESKGSVSGTVEL
jgi:hypothetical protein